MRCNITAPPYYPQWKVGERLFRSRRYRREEGEATVWRRPLYAETALHPKNDCCFIWELCIEQFFPTDGAASLEAGSDYRRWVLTFCTPGNAPAGDTPARTVLHIFRITGRHARLRKWREKASAAA